MQYFNLDIFKKKNNELKEDIICFNVEDQITSKVRDFYNVKPFPNYDNLENKHSLSIKGKNNLLLSQLKDFIGYKKNFLEVGSGTCQLSLYLSIGTNNNIFALDPSFESLKLGKNFAKNNNINNVTFISADIFDDVLAPNIFDFIWCNGVLHHTKDPYLGFQIIIKSLKKNGYIIVGLYNKIGRLRTIIRKFFYKIFGENFLFLFDPTLKKLKISEDQKKAWIRDQYEHPVESRHTFDEILDWFEKNNIEFINSIPASNLFSNEINLFEKTKKNNSLINLLIQFFMIFTKIGSDGGLFIFIGKKK